MVYIHPTPSVRWGKQRIARGALARSSRFLSFGTAPRRHVARARVYVRTRSLLLSRYLREPFRARSPNVFARGSSSIIEERASECARRLCFWGKGLSLDTSLEVRGRCNFPARDGVARDSRVRVEGVN